MKNILNLSCTILLCLSFAVSVTAQQFKLTATPNSPYSFENIYDLRNSVAAALPAGLVRFQANATNLFGTSIQPYNLATGAVVNPVFNYAIPAGITVRNLRGAKFTEGASSYFFAGTVDEVLAAGTREHIFVTRVNSANGIIIASRRVVLPTTLLRPVVSNILLVGDLLYVSGTVFFNNRQHVFAFRTDLNINALGWFRLYPLANRNFVTFGQCLMNDGVNGLVLAGVDQNNGRSVVFKVDPATGVIVGAVTAYSLCTALSCRKINYVSIGRSGNFRDMFVQTTANVVGNVLFNISQMNGTWTNFVAGTTYNTNNWTIRSVRFENGGVLLSHLDNGVLRFNRSRYNGGNGALIAGTPAIYLPPASDLIGVVRQIETITMPNNRTFSVGKYRNLPVNTTRTFVEMQPAACQGVFGLQPAGDSLRPMAEIIISVPLQIPVVLLPTIIVQLPSAPIQICAAAGIGDGVGDRSETTTAEMGTAITTLRTSPNPFNNTMTVSLDEGAIAAVRLFDLTGKVLQEWQFSGTEPSVALEMPALTNGLYLLRVRDSENQWHFRKVMKQ